jgi:hypothetical protein
MAKPCRFFVGIHRHINLVLGKNNHPILFNLHSLRDELIPIRKTTDRTIWWRYQITKKKEKTSKVHHS